MWARPGPVMAVSLRRERGELSETRQSGQTGVGDFGVGEGEGFEVGQGGDEGDFEVGELGAGDAEVADGAGVEVEDAETQAAVHCAHFFELLDRVFGVDGAESSGVIGGVRGRERGEKERGSDQEEQMRGAWWTGSGMDSDGVPAWW